MNAITIVCYTEPIPAEVTAEIVALAAECKIEEAYDAGCDLVYTWVENKKIVAVIAFKRVLFSDGRTIPRWEHVFYHKSVKTTKKALLFLLSVEQQVYEYGFKQVMAYVESTRKYMLDYALKFGFREYATSGNGSFLVKDLTNNKRT